MNKKIAIIGAGGHGKVIGEIASLNKYEVINFFDNRADEIKEFPFTIIGNLDYLKDHLNDYDSFFIAIGKNKLRFDNGVLNEPSLPKTVENTTEPFVIVVPSTSYETNEVVASISV